MTPLHSEKSHANLAASRARDVPVIRTSTGPSGMSERLRAAQLEAAQVNCTLALRTRRTYQAAYPVSATRRIK